MEIDFVIVFALLASVFGGLALILGQRRWTARRDAGLLRATRRLGGTVSDATGLEPRTLRFVIEGRPAIFEFERGEGNLTRVRVSIPNRSPGVFRIARRGAVRRSLRFSMPDLKVGDAAFDREWYIGARPPSLVPRIFSEDRRDQVIGSVERIGRLDVPTIEITRDTLVVRVNGLLQREEDLHDLAMTATDFVGYLMRLGPDEGIAWVAGGEADPGICPVCAVPMESTVVRCDKCGTPHHEECWTYVGQCSTYACKGKRWVS